ncbi:hypothetical protein CAOG_03834 [Capsaspora owczarzaki ATCC 30864]|uniref:SAM domain-containing protein n=1 Tax=Capsaspora owczarzaki (strain ATCC 30864) TaxID=595528 RepID=A0A0D2X2Q4_CAPO3|nr:hypothetical protein CAOG_03834 [Capsaspora owczarzaki ATCC 30864]KJE92964.1 hypothetical protein CAOG_003834 [Capsaspora owczarzaki ATCC 30864]|eukprot:XP_004363562.1 hypothetical protein CAOG_03834 [Capsaspora owczarzaki ATCC 30864]
MGKEQDLLKASAEGDLKTVRRILANQTGGVLGSLMKKNDDLGAFEMPKEKIPLQHIAIDCRDDDNYTPMSLAALNGHTDIVELLIMHMAGLNRKDKNGNAPLHLVAVQGHGAIMDLLLAHQAKVNNKNNTGDNPLHFAAQYGRSLLIVKLLNAGADLLDTNNAGETCLDVAARFDRRETVSLLIDTDPRILKSTKSLIDAATTGRKEVVSILVNAGMDVNATAPATGSTALHEAARFFRKEIVQFLLDHGADANIRNNAGETPFSIVQAYQQAKENDLYPIFIQAQNRPPAIPARPGQAPPLPSRPGRPGGAPVPGGAAAPPPVPKKRTKRFPILIPAETWTQNTDKYRTLAEGANRATNVLLDDPAKYWVATSATNNWIIFDLGVEFNLTGVRIETISDTRTPKTFDIQTGKSLAGPWTTIMTHNIDNKGPTDAAARGEFQEFMGFDASSQFWRLMFKNNYGGFHTLVKQIQFFGLECRLESWLTALGMQQYFVNFLENDISQLTRLALMSETEVKNIIQLAGHRKKLMMAVKEIKDQVCALTKLKFTKMPCNHTFDMAVLPPFEVTGDPGSEEQIGIVAHGGAIVGGTSLKRLVPDGLNPSKVVFDDITLSPAGTYLLEAQALGNPAVLCRQDKPIVVEFQLKDNSALNSMFDDLDSMLKF